MSQPVALLATLLFLGLTVSSTGAQNLWEEVLDREWEVQTVNGVSLLPGTAMTLRFSKNGRVSGHAGANRFTGSFTHCGTNTLDLGPIATTRIFLDQPPGRMAQESAYLEALQAADRITLDRGRLVLLRGNRELVRLAQD